MEKSPTEEETDSLAKLALLAMLPGLSGLSETRKTRGATIGQRIGSVYMRRMQKDFEIIWEDKALLREETRAKLRRNWRDTTTIYDETLNILRGPHLPWKFVRKDTKDYLMNYRDAVNPIETYV